MEMKTAALAGLLGLTPRRLNQLALEGIAVRISPGSFDAAKTVQAVIAHAGGKTAGRAADLDLNRENARLASERADAQAMKNAVTKGDLLPREDVERTWQDVLRRVRSGVLAVTSRVRHRISTMDAAQAAILDRELRDALSALSENADHLTAGDGELTPAAAPALVDMAGADISAA